MKGPLFYSKILLFGEYGIIKDSKGLSIPYNFFKGALKTSDELTDEAKQSNQYLKEYADYLADISIEDNDVSFDITALKNDVANGMYFDSSIPQGYGVGSSGALVAAIYDKYASNKITVLENLTKAKLLELKANPDRAAQGAVIEAQHGAVRFNAARGHASAGAAALVEQGDVVAESGQPRGAAETGHAGADDRNLHRPVRLRHRP